MNTSQQHSKTSKGIEPSKTPSLHRKRMSGDRTTVKRETRNRSEATEMTNDQIIETLKEAKEALDEGFPLTAKDLIEKLTAHMEVDEERFIERRGFPVDG